MDAAPRTRSTRVALDLSVGPRTSSTFRERARRLPRPRSTPPAPASALEFPTSLSAVTMQRTSCPPIAPRQRPPRSTSKTQAATRDPCGATRPSSRAGQLGQA